MMVMTMKRNNQSQLIRNQAINDYSRNLGSAALDAGIGPGTH